MEKKKSNSVYHKIKFMSNHLSSVSKQPKRGFALAKQAQREAFKMSEKYKCKMTYYKCPVCNKYHIGKVTEGAK